VKVIYQPVEVGFLNIVVKWNGKHIVNSPFKAIVTNPGSSVRSKRNDPRTVFLERIRTVGGWQSVFDAQNHISVITNEEKKICFDTSQAGPGMFFRLLTCAHLTYSSVGVLKADVRSVESAYLPLRIDQQGPLSTLTLTARREGEYDLTISHAAHPLPNMPIRIVAVSASSEPLRVGIYGRGSYEARVNEDVEFFIDASRAPAHASNQLVVRLTGKQADIDVRIRQIEKNRNIFICSYKATIPGKAAF
jgi:filamin